MKESLINVLSDQRDTLNNIMYTQMLHPAMRDEFLSNIFKTEKLINKLEYNS